MSRRLTKADWTAAGAAVTGLIVTFLPWYTYTQGSAHITVNGFRASLMGDVFFVAVAVLALLLLMRLGFVSDILRRRISPRLAYAVVAGVGIASVLDQLLLVAGGRRSVAPGLILALLVAAGMAAAAWLRSLERQPSRTPSAY